MSHLLVYKMNGHTTTLYKMSLHGVTLITSLNICIGHRFRAEDHLSEIKDFFHRESGQVHMHLAMLDLFGASGRMAQCWTSKGFHSACFDIKRSLTQDPTESNSIQFQPSSSGVVDALVCLNTVLYNFSVCFVRCCCRTSRRALAGLN